ncbi:MAG: hypothetical protein KKC20_05555 [Proteobacteria bacterium]|nr:hypothetical protein [Pseudomonadota bacterium]
MAISKEGLSQSLLISSSENFDVFMEKIRANKIDKAPSNIIDEEGARNLFSLLTYLGSEEITYLANMLETDSSINKTDLLSALATAKDSAGDMLGVISKLDPDERDHFLSLAAQVGSESSSDLVKIAERVGNTDLHLDFLTLAKDLNGEDLSNLIKAGADNPDSMADLVKMTGKLGKTDRKYFLKAAADSPNLGLLISNTQNLDMDKRTDFLFAAAKSGKALKELVGLSTRMSGDVFQRDIRSMASTLSQGEFDDYLAASIHSGDETQALHELTSALQESQRSSFLKAAAGAGQNTLELTDQVSGFGQNLADLDNFLAAALHTSEMGQLLSLTGQAGDERSGFLELVGNLNTADLQNFFAGAGEMSSFTLINFIDQAGELSGLERSHFLFGASKVGDHQDDYMDLVGKLDGEERTGMLLVIANGNSEEAPSMITRMKNMEAGDQRAAVIADERLLVILAEKKPMSSEYVHLTNFLDADEYNDFLTAIGLPGNEDEAERLLESSETVSDRSSFLAAAADSKTQLAHLLDMGEKLSGETRETFMAVVGNLRGENIESFVRIAFDSNENLDEFLKLTDKLTGQEKDDFLKASVDAREQGVLKEFMGLTNRLAGPQRSLFLNVAETAGKQLGNLIQGMNNNSSSQEELFMANAKANGYDLSTLIKYDEKDSTKIDSLWGVKPDYMFTFLENAIASKPLLGNYLKSYL